MCCRYYIGEGEPDAVLAEFFAQAGRRAKTMQLPITMLGEVRPADIVPIIAPSADKREAGGFPMRCGLLHPTRGSLIFNTRSETAGRSPLFAESAQNRRCLIPTSHYFEWQKSEGKKTKYAISPGYTPFYLAGIYFRIPGESLPRFSVLTKDAAPEIQFIHNRMPVIVPEKQVQLWLNAEVKYGDIMGELERVPYSASAVVLS